MKCINTSGMKKTSVANINISISKELFLVLLKSIKISSTAYRLAVADAGVICWEMVHNTSCYTVESLYVVQKSCLPTILPTTEDNPVSFRKRDMKI